jgi:cardiolipin synthase
MFVEEYLADLRRDRFSPAAIGTWIRRSLTLARDTAFRRPEAMRSIGLTGVVGFLVLLAFAIATALLVSRSLAIELFVQTGFMLLAGLAAVAGHLRLLVDADGRPLRAINAANLFTLARLVLIPAVVGFAGAGHAAVAAVIFGIGAVTDVVDGWLARRHGQATPFGRAFDPIVDILFNASVFLALFGIGLLPAWVLLLVVTRYGLLLGGGVLLSIFRGPIEIKPTILGKTTGVVMTLLVLALVGGRFLVSPELFGPVEGLLVVAIGFVEAITIPQVLAIGWSNFRRAGMRAAEAELRLVPPSDPRAAAR